MGRPPAEGGQNTSSFPVRKTPGQSPAPVGLGPRAWRGYAGSMGSTAGQVWDAILAGDALAAVLDEELPHPDLEWARSGAMALAGDPDGPPQLAPAPLATAARAALQLLARLSGCAAIGTVDGAALLGERAACFGHRRRGRISPGGSCRLVRCAEGWLAVNLAREDDVACLPAWFGEAAPAWCGEAAHPEVWEFVETRAAVRSVAALAERARLLGMPVSPAMAPPAGPAPWCGVSVRGASRRREPEARPLVVDLSSLWAGPLCAHLLGLAGARVLKVESRSRPDGARRGSPHFFRLLNGNKECVALELDELWDVIERADVVIEGSRPRALHQLGIDAAAAVRERAGLTWIGLSGHGREPPCGDWVAFGDDATAAGGLCTATGTPGAPMFCGDAIADPLAGLHAAVAALASFRLGGGHLVDVSLAGCVRHLVAHPGRAREGRVVGGPDRFAVEVGGIRAPVLPPRARPC